MTNPTFDSLNEPRDFYHALTYGSADDNILVVPNIPRYAGEVRFYPTGRVTLIDYGTANGTYVQDSLNDEWSDYVFGFRMLSENDVLTFADRANYSTTDLRRLLLKHNNTDALFTGAQVRLYKAFLQEQYDKNKSNKNDTILNYARDQRNALSTYDAYGF